MQNFNDHITLTVPNHHTARTVLLDALDAHIQYLNGNLEFMADYYEAIEPDKLDLFQNQLAVARRMASQLSVASVS